MKPKNLKPPYSWENRKPVLEDGILYLPHYFFEHEAYHFPLWEGVFQKKQPVKIEFCSGNGKWIVDRAKQEPSINWVAVEMQFDRLRKIWSKRENENLENLFLVCGDAKVLARFHIPDATVEEVFINFPDPWPKQRHAKNRLMKQEFLQELSRILQPNGKITFVTDDKPYLEETLHCFRNDLSFRNIELLSEIPNYGTSYFDDLWRQQGKEIHFLQVSHHA